MSFLPLDIPTYDAMNEKYRFLGSAATHVIVRPLSYKEQFHGERKTSLPRL